MKHTKEEDKEYDDIYDEVYADKKTYEIVYDAVRGQTGIRCKKCNLTSYSFEDIRDKYCGKCNMFHKKII